MKWLKITICTVSLLIAGFNLISLFKNVILSYESPLETRAILGKHNMEEMIDLADQHLPSSRNDLKLGIWYPFNDVVTRNHLNMIMTYYLYPLKAATAQSNNMARLNYITGYSSHTGKLRSVLSALEIENSFVQIATNASFTLLKRAGHEETASTSLKQKDAAPSHISRRLIGILLGFAMLLPAGWLLVRGLSPGIPEAPLFFKLFAAWTAGILLIVLLVPLFYLIGLPTSHGTIILMLITFTLLSFLFWRMRNKNCTSSEQSATTMIQRPQEKNNRILYFTGWSAAIILSLTWCLLIILECASSPMHDITGLGVWGLKAKAFYQAGGIDFPLLNDPECSFCHPSYPLGFPMLLTYCCSWMGGMDDWLIRLVPAILGFSVGICLYILLRKLGVHNTGSAIASLLFCSGTILSTQSTFVEAETLLLLMCLTGFFFLMDYLKTGNRPSLWLGMLFLAGAACTKQEGVVMFATGALLTALLSRGFNFKANPAAAGQDVLALLVIIALFILPWQAYCRWNSLPVNDFNRSAMSARTTEANALVWSDGIMSFIRQMFVIPSSVAWIWTAGTLITLANLRFLRSRKELMLLLGSCCVLIPFFGSIYLFSIYPTDRLDWHMQASDRLLLLPTCLFLLLSAYLLNQSSGKKQHDHSQKEGTYK